VESHRQDRSPRVLVPPKNKARIKPESPTTRERNRNVRGRAQLGKRDWHQKSGYSLRAKVETSVSRYKIIFGPAVRARRLAAQRAEARIRCQILNAMTALGMPEGHMAGEKARAGEALRASLICATKQQDSQTQEGCGRLISEQRAHAPGPPRANSASRNGGRQVSRGRSRHGGWPQVSRRAPRFRESENQTVDRKEHCTGRHGTW